MDVTWPRLHDSVGTTPRRGRGAAGATYEAALASWTTGRPARADIVSAVTNPPREPGRDRHEQYREHVADSLDTNPWARVVKVSDFTDNGVGVIHSAPDLLRRMATKYRPVVPILRELVGRPDTPLSDRVKQHIFEQLDLAEERFDAILAP